MVDWDLDDYDTEKIFFAIILTVIIVGVIFVFGMTQYNKYTADKLAPYKTICKANPRERMGQTCTTQEDCIIKCSERLWTKAQIKQ